MYKDKDKQREAVKAATRRYRGKKGDSALSDSKEGLENARGLPVLDELGDTQPVIPSCDTPEVIPKQGKDIKTIFNAGELSPCLEPRDVANVLGKPKRVMGMIPNCQRPVPNPNPKRGKDIKIAITGKPGDADYNGICTKEWRAERGR